MLAASTCLLLCAGACGGGDAADEYPLSLENGPPAELLDALEAEGLDDDAAMARFEQVMLLSDAYRTRQKNPALRQRDDADGRAFRARATLARLWLTEVFERDHGSESLPAEAYSAELRRIQFGRVSKLCQVILMPKGLEGDALTERTQSAEFREVVRGPANDLTALLRTFVTDNSRTKPCEIFQRVVHTYAGPRNQNIPEGITIKLESAAMDTCNEELWVKPWVDAVCPVEEFSTLDPVWTKYGAHVVTVLDVLPASTLSAEEQDSLAREQATPAWRTKRLAAELERLAQRFDVGMSRDLPAP